MADVRDNPWHRGLQGAQLDILPALNGGACRAPGHCGASSCENGHGAAVGGMSFVTTAAANHPWHTRPLRPLSWQ